MDALAAHGLSAAFVCWDDPDARWTSAGVVVIRSTWDYHRRLEAFLGWADYVGSVTTLCNSPAIVRWNSHKRYLLELADLGVPTVPTELVLAGHGTTLGPGRHVIKPAVSVGADRTVRNATQADLDALVATDDVLVQPYLSEVETGGELSIVCIDGRPTHVLRKVPAAGDFRAQEQTRRVDRRDAARAAARVDRRGRARRGRRRHVVSRESTSSRRTASFG